MLKPLTFFSFVCIFFIALSTNAAEPEFSWPNGAKAAVSLSYDDALDSQLKNVVPVLNDSKLRASFYVHIDSPGFTAHADEWKEVAQAGHELGNHSLFHQCVKSEDRTWLPPHHDLQVISAEQMRDEIRLANQVLHTLDGRSARTLTIPCGDFTASGENYIELLKEDFLGIKALNGDVPSTMENYNRHYVSVLAVHDISSEGLIKIVEKAKKNGTIANILFHGVGGDYMTVANEEHKKFIEYLAKHQDSYWVDTFANIMQHVKDYEIASQQAESGNQITAK